MKLTVELAIKIAKKYNFSYDKDCNAIYNPNDVQIDHDSFIFMRFVSGSEGFEYSCAYEFGVTALKTGKFGYHTTLFKKITTIEEFEENIKIFLSFVELTKPLEKKYVEQIKLNKIGGDF